jgi:protoheme IX farnesyltransferase
MNISGGLIKSESTDNEGGSTFRQMWIASLVLIAATLAPGLIGKTGKFYLYFGLALAIGLLFFVYRLSSRRSKNAARQLLYATVIYLPLLYLVMVLDRAFLPTG